MKRREPGVVELGLRGLTPPALRPRPVDDLSLSVAERVRIFEAWMVERDAWVEARRVYAEAHGWPGGDFEREREEWEAHPVGDAPFDLASI